ncbi:MAG: BrnA antitoxin family protein [Acidobacteria bacterium]|nr:BrnA antitoxin family protein [Acidobacteriota bacterium]
MKPGTYKVRRSPWAEKIKKAGKVKITIYLDGDVVEYFRSRSDAPNAAPYQTQINNELRKVMERAFTESKSVEDKLLNDKTFLKALKKKLETI